MVTSSEKYIERLIELLQKKMGLLQEIFLLTQKQTATITEDGLDDLGKLIDEKQNRIDAIDKLDEEFGTYFHRFKSTLGISKLEELDESRLGPEASSLARQLKKLTSDILNTIRGINDMESANSQKSKDLLDRFGSEVRKINQGKKVNNAYNSYRAGTHSAPAYFIDKKK